MGEGMPSPNSNGRKNAPLTVLLTMKVGKCQQQFQLRIIKSQIQEDEAALEWKGETVDKEPIAKAPEEE